MRRWQQVWLGLALVAGIAASPAIAATAQERYDAAQAAFDGGNWEKAREGFASLIPAAPAPLKSSQAVIAARLAEAQYHLNDFTAARATATRAVAGLADNPAERRIAQVTLGDAARADLDMPTSIATFKALDAEAGNDTRLRLRAAVGIAQAAVVFDPPTAAAALDAVQADVGMMKLLDKPMQAQLLALRGRAAFNAGDAASASRYFDRAISASGGLTSRVSLTQVAIRSDAAIAKHLLGNEEAVRNLLTYAGAGHIDWTDVSRGNMPLPQCALPGDRDDAPRRDDAVVIEFAINDDGNVDAAQTIYASRPGAMGLGFAALARDWSWPAKVTAAMDPFWRKLIRMEVRCTSQPNRRSVKTFYMEASNAWLKQLAASPPADTAARAAATELAAALRNPDATADKVRPLLDTLDAPPDARAWILLQLLRSGAYGNSSQAAAGVRVLTPLATEFAMRWPQSRALAVVKLALARAQLTAGQTKAARTTLEEILALPEAATPAETDIRPVATMLLATADKRDGDKEAALRRAGTAGINEQQCALFDLTPMATSTAYSSDDYPEEALSMGFEGSVLLGYDVDANGRTAGVRTLAAYPPFVFNANAEAIVRRTRYVPPVFDGTATGCNGSSRWLTFVMP